MGSILRTRAIAGVALVAASLGLAACASELTRTGSSPAFLIIDSLQGASGAEPDKFGAPLFSDVVTIVEQQIGGQTVRVPTVFSDLGQARVRQALRNPNSPTGPSSVNAITINRYRVVFRRADGRNTPGVDVPHAFDGAVTFTVPADGTAGTFGFEIVRHQAKQEPPLRNLVGDGGSMIISTIAEITFFGRDQVGNEVQVTGTLSVNFADFGDPQR
jgi:hypothetical protein